MLQHTRHTGCRRRRLICGSLAATMLIVLAGCAGTVRMETAPTAEAVTAVEQEAAPSVTWAADVRAIVESRCSPCHLPGGYMYGRAPLDSYDNASRRSSRVRALVFEARTMPFQGSMPDAERELVARWIDAGAPRQ